MKTFNMHDSTAERLQKEQDRRNKAAGADNKHHPNWWTKNMILEDLMDQAEGKPAPIKLEFSRQPQPVLPAPKARGTVYGSRT